MSDTLLSTDKIAVGSFTGPAPKPVKQKRGQDKVTPPPGRQLIQLTIRDGSDITTLTKAETRELRDTLSTWLYNNPGD